jgi:hypothetical protein
VWEDRNDPDLDMTKLPKTLSDETHWDDLERTDISHFSELISMTIIHEVGCSLIGRNSALVLTGTQRKHTQKRYDATSPGGDPDIIDFGDCSYGYVNILAWDRNDAMRNADNYGKSGVSPNTFGASLANTLA